MPYYTDRAWWTVDDAARLLRVNRKTLYDACNADDFAHKRLGRYIRIPAEALGMLVRPETRTRTYHVTDEPAQLELPLDALCLVPVKRFRNTRERITPWHYEDNLYCQKARMTPRTA
ncbi:helix-turn-helix domain-containing protein [Nocardioides sp. Leaf307]|uniref:helix-turn-helix domain-containing protein n=1 Tax=Nocardioides sp. Leaf307 TaxID=1736331 RepID=UPI0009E9E521